MDLGIGKIFFESIGSGRDKRNVVFAPDGKQRWLMFAEILLKLRIEFDVCLIVENQIRLNLVNSFTLHVKNIKRIPVW